MTRSCTLLAMFLAEATFQVGSGTVDETSKPGCLLSHNVVEMIDAGMTAYRRQLGTGRQVPLSGRHCRAWSATGRLSAAGRGGMGRGRRRSAVIL